MTVRVYPDWRARIVFAQDGPRPQLLLDATQFKVVLVGLQSGQNLFPVQGSRVAIGHNHSVGRSPSLHDKTSDPSQISLAYFNLVAAFC